MKDRFGCPGHLSKYRFHLAGDWGDETNGILDYKPMGLRIMFSNGDGWEHVSVSRKSRTPSYEDMCWAKETFWPDGACVMQLHVPKQDHINAHPFCLHLWCPIEQEIPRPPGYMVG